MHSPLRVRCRDVVNLVLHTIWGRASEGLSSFGSHVLPCGPLNLVKGIRTSLFYNFLDGRNRAIVLAESLARVIAAIRIASVRWRSYRPPNTEINPHRPCVGCAAIQMARLAFTRLTFVPRGTAGWLARVDRVR